MFPPGLVGITEGSGTMKKGSIQVAGKFIHPDNDFLCKARRLWGTARDRQAGTDRPVLTRPGQSAMGWR